MFVDKGHVLCFQISKLHCYPILIPNKSLTHEIKDDFDQLIDTYLLTYLLTLFGVYLMFYDRQINISIILMLFFT